jgi:hypothetical protein
VLRVHSDTRSEFVNEFTDELLTKIEAKLSNEEVASGESESDGSQEEETPPKTLSMGDSPATGIFGKSKYTRAPKPDIRLGTKKAQAGSPQTPASGSTHTPTPPASPIAPTPVSPVLASSATPSSPTGFWKVLSKFDVSTTSAPGQIIIPIEFQDFFEPLTLTKPSDAGGRGRQWEASFPIQFVDGAFRVVANDARCIVYEPETGHPRPNTECRFTFRNRDILTRLTKGDILVFRVAAGGSVKFIVDKLSLHMPWYLKLYAGKGRKWGILS